MAERVGVTGGWLCPRGFCLAFSKKGVWPRRLCPGSLSGHRSEPYRATTQLRQYVWSSDASGITKPSVGPRHFLMLGPLWFICRCSIASKSACISSRYRDNGSQICWDHDLALSRSCDVIGHVTTIRFVISHFLLVVLWIRASICLGFRDIEP